MGIQHTYFAAIIVLACALSACGGNSGSTDPATNTTPPQTVTSPTPNDPPQTSTGPLPAEPGPGEPTCRAGARPAASEVVFSRAFPNLTFNQPVALLQGAGSDSFWYVVEKPGRILRFADDAAVTSTQTFIDLTNRVDDRSEGGLLGFAFHPQYARTRWVFLSYTTSDADGGNFRSVISRFEAALDGQSLLANTEHILLTLPQPFDNHNGGHIAFGADGYLYIGFGDGGSGGDPNDNAQNTRNWLGDMLRVQVDVTATQESQSVFYTIPGDNPFASSAACSATENCPEIYAWGLRNPWRWSFDRLTGELWAGDVGQGAWEEIDIIERGKNYGWRCFEGNHPFNLANCDANESVAPIYEYEHPGGDNRSVTGGFVYRGAALPQLDGVYIFGDFISGTVWGLTRTASGVSVVELAQSVGNISAFGEGRDGDLYIVEFGGGTILRMDAAPTVSGTSPFATSLSQTGCADSANPALPAPGMIPFAVNAPLWSDGLIKTRWLSIPNGITIQVDGQQDWQLPQGSVLRKDFYFGNQLIETRLLAHHTDGGWAGYSYEWNDIGTDAVLLNGGKNRTVGNQVWSYPSGSQCLQCHTASAGRTLGLETAQFNRSGPHETRNQLERLQSSGILPVIINPPRLVNPSDTTANLSERARAYLHVNCSQCHRPGGPGRGASDFRDQVSFTDMHVCSEPAQTNDFGLSNPRLLIPGDSANSIIVRRLQAANDQRMPPLGTNVLDNEGIRLIEQWIQSIPNC